MTRKKVTAVFCLLLAGLMLMELRLLAIMSDGELAEAAARQSSRAVELARLRPDFYDVNGEPLTGLGEGAVALAFPKTATGYSLLPYIEQGSQTSFLEQMQGGAPFAVRVSAAAVGAVAERTVSVGARYDEGSLCRHLIGTLEASGAGASGLEYALESYFASGTQTLYASYYVNANGEPISARAEITRRGVRGAGVWLTIDSRVQRAVESAAAPLIERGAVVVLDAGTAEVRAMASFPSFEQNDVASALEDERSPLFNRALAAYNVGSIYKPVLAACALGAGLGEGYGHLCSGQIEIDSNIYTCNDSAAHGELDMRGAIVKSCNTYFIALGNELGANAIYNTAAALGLNRPIELCEGLASASGSFPSAGELASPGELSNHCFGQGKLLLTPLHVAAYTRCIAMGGMYLEPSVIKRVGGEAVEPQKASRALGESAAEAVAEYMREAVESGTGTNAKPQKRSAAGKTGTAQTGLYNADGSQRTIGWFTGFFPAEEPRYIVTVMTEDGGYGYESAAPVFAAVANELVALGLA